MFDVEHGTALQEMQVNWAASCGEGEVSLFF